MSGKYSVLNLLKVYRDNKNVIEAYISGNSVEGLDDDHEPFESYGGLFAFLIIVLITLPIFILSIVWTFKYWDILPDWAKVLAILGLFGGNGGPIMTLVAIYIAKNHIGMESTPQEWS